MRIIFMGSPQEVVRPLEILMRLCETADHDLVGVISQPAKPAGRKKKLTDPPLAAFAKDLGLKVLQPVKARDPDFLNELRQLAPDLIITAAYGQILSEEFLAIPTRGTVNIHPSLLPEYRGATPVQTALYHGKTITGVTLLFTVKALDAGHIISQKEVEVLSTETSAELMPRLFDIGGQLIEAVLQKLADPDYLGTPQNPDQVTHCHKFDKESGHIDWSLATGVIYNRYRALKPWPGTYAYFGGKRVLFESIRPIDGEFSLSTREFTYSKAAKSLVVKTIDGYLALDRVKPEGSKALEGAAFWNGLKLKSKGIFDE